MATTLIDSLKKSVGKKKGKTLAYAWLADMERNAGDLDCALQRVDGGLTEFPRDVMGLLVRSMILFEKEDFQGCVETCEKVLLVDPFCLSAQKRMGDAYDKLGNELERNKCYRRVHDMDPLDNFWKEEYENGMDLAAATAVASEFAMPDVPESELSMGDMSFGEVSDEIQKNDEIEGGFFEKAPDESAEEEKGPKFGSGFDLAFDEPAEIQESPEVAADKTATFSSGFDMEPEVSEEPQESFEDVSKPMDLGESEPVAEDDPFASLSALLPNVDSNEDAIMDSLQESLDSAMAELEGQEPSAPEVFPTDDEVSGNDVNSAIADMFGLEDDLEPEETVAPASPFASLDLPTSLDSETPSTEATAQMVFGSEPAEDKPQSIDSAFDSIFGEDELPEELPQPAVESDGSLFEKSAAESLTLTDEAPLQDASQDVAAAETSSLEKPQAEAQADGPQSIDSAFDSIFGEDELPEELPQPAVEEASTESLSDITLSAESESEGSLFEKSAAESLTLTDEAPLQDASQDVAAAETSSLEEPQAEAQADGPQSIDSAFDSIFGEDELPEELPQPAVESEGSLFEKSADESLTLADDASLDIPAAETSSLEMPQAEAQADGPQSIDSAFDSIFGEDELPEELPQPAVESEGSLFEKSADESLTLADDASQDVAAAETSSLEEPQAEAQAEGPQSIDSAFDSIFGEDELPEEKPTASLEQTNVQEEALEKTAEVTVDNGPSVESEMGNAFASMFGDDDDLDLPEENVSSAPSQEDTSAALEEKSVPEVSPATDLESLDSAISGAFKGLFDTEDDDVPEEVPNNSGMDFLMSGDSDDEVSNSLLKDPTAPLSRTPADLDESLNTRTLAEIYFEQGLYGKALDIYEDLARKEPDNQEITDRMMEVEKIYREKFGDNANG